VDDCLQPLRTKFVIPEVILLDRGNSTACELPVEGDQGPLGLKRNSSRTLDPMEKPEPFSGTANDRFYKNSCSASGAYARSGVW